VRYRTSVCEYGDGIVDNRMAHEYLLPYYSEFTIGHHIHRLRGAAQRLVRDAQPKIKLIADALIKHGSLDGDAIYDLATETLPMPNKEPRHRATGSGRL
jgi:hypothetical protein